RLSPGGRLFARGVPVRRRTSRTVPASPPAHGRPGAHSPSPVSGRSKYGPAPGVRVRGRTRCFENVQDGSGLLALRVLRLGGRGLLSGALSGSGVLLGRLPGVRGVPGALGALAVLGPDGLAAQLPLDGVDVDDVAGLVLHGGVLDDEVQRLVAQDLR